MSQQTTIHLSDAKKDWLWKFCAAHRQFADAKKVGVAHAIQYWDLEMRKYMMLVDLGTRLENEMRGRTK